MTALTINDALAPVEHSEGKLHDARSLHAWLGVGRPFASWFAKVAADYGFSAGRDFFPETEKRSGGRPRKDYLMTATMAKEVAMIGNTPVGRETRRYFIRMEAAAVEMAQAHVEHGTAEAIPQDFFDARAAFAELTSSFEARFAALEARAPAPAPEPVLPERVTARAVAEYMGVLDVRLPAKAQADLCGKIGLELTGHCRLNGFIVERRSVGGTTSNVYERAGVLDWLNRNSTMRN